VPLVRALAQSLNQATVNLGMDVGLPKIADKFAQLGLAQAPEAVPAMLLGGVTAAPVDVAQIYTSLANGGFRSPLRAVRAVIDDKGQQLKAFPLEVTQVAEPDAVYQVDRMMVEVTRRGTGASIQSKLGNLVLAGKTGTSSDYRDSWFAGFSSNYVAVTWIGYDDNEPTRFTGATGALSIWTNIMAGIDNRSWDQPLPESLVEKQIEFATGFGVTNGCSDKPLTVAVPPNTEIAMKEGCSNPATSLTERAGNWLRGMMAK